jgi:glycosyltransferase involved in cell wall biosynthesis
MLRGHPDHSLSLRILHVIESMGMGGAERHLSNLLEPLQRLGVENHVATLWPGAAYSERVAPFAKVHRFDLPNRRVTSALPGLIRLARQTDVVHTQLPWADIAGRLGAIAAGRPSVTTLQSTWYASTNTLSFDPALRRRVGLVRRLDAWTAKRTRRFFAVSEATKRTYVDELGLPPERIDVIPNSVDLARFDPSRLPSREEMRRALGFAADEFAVLMLARLVQPKGHVDAIRAVAQIRERPIRLYIAGTGPEEQALRVLVTELRAPVTFLGPRSDVQSLLHAADLFLFPSMYEGLPLALIEAMAMQRACLCSDIPENRETAGDSVIYAPPGDVAALTRELRVLVTNDELRAWLSSGARERVQRFSSERIAAQLLAAIESVLGRQRDGHVVAT